MRYPEGPCTHALKYLNRDYLRPQHILYEHLELDPSHRMGCPKSVLLQYCLSGWVVKCEGPNVRIPTTVLVQ